MGEGGINRNFQFSLDPVLSLNVLLLWVAMPPPLQFPLLDPSGSGVRQGYLLLCGYMADGGPP